jgi:molybdate-binding protein/DNA-binding transcriptional regulator YhcF (GntR family)
MSKTYLYQQIVEAMRQQILAGEIRAGDRLPSVREMAARWECTIGTVQRAYQELAQEGLVISRAGQGTHVVDRPPRQEETPLRRAALIHRAESFLLEVLTAGYSPADVEDAVRQALDRWRVVSLEPAPQVLESLRFVGSHDLAVAWLASHFSEIAPGYALQVRFAGSLGGLIALAEGQADVAGCHLWDEETNTYNAPFVRRLLPGKRVALVSLAHRRLGLIVPAGNPGNVHDLRDVARPGVRFVNRQAGSGTRVWLDVSLRKLGLSPASIQGYYEAKMTHFDVARAIVEGEADVGLGLEAAARTYGLGFVLLNRERYDLAIPASQFDLAPVQALVQWLGGTAGQKALAHFAGYDASGAGQVEWIE